MTNRQTPTVVAIAKVLHDWMTESGWLPTAPEDADVDYPEHVDPHDALDFIDRLEREGFTVEETVAL